MVKRQAAIAVVVLVVMVLVVIANSVGTVHAAGLALDGAGSNTCTGTTASVTCSVTLTTSNSNDIIIAIATADGESCLPTLGTPTASGLIFTLRKSDSEPLGEWWALATSTLTSETITITIAESGQCGGNLVATLIVWGIAGANTVTPFDPHLGLPSENSGSGSSGSVVVSTSNGNDMLLGMVGGYCTSDSILVCPGGGTAGPGFTVIKPDSGAIAASEYEVVSSTQSGLTVTINFGGSTPWDMFGDAVQAAASPPPPVPEYPLGLAFLAIIAVIAYGVMRRRIQVIAHIIEPNFN